MTTDAPLQFHPEETIARYGCTALMERYYSLVMEENRRVNLVSRETSRADFLRLCAESLLPLDRVTTPVARYLDIGSGGGLPAIPLLAAGAVRGEAVLVERTGRKASALRRMLLALDLRAEVMARDAFACSFTAPFDLVTLRLVQATPRLLAYLSSVTAPGGVIVHYGRPDPLPDTAEITRYQAHPDGPVKFLTYIHIR